MTTGEVTGSSISTTPGLASVVSRLAAKGARDLSSLLFFFFVFFPSASCRLVSLRNKVTAERSAPLKPRAGNGSRRPEAKYIRVLSDRDSGGTVCSVFFLSFCVICLSRLFIYLYRFNKEELRINSDHAQNIRPLVHIHKKKKKKMKQKIIFLGKYRLISRNSYII